MIYRSPNGLKVEKLQHLEQHYSALTKRRVGLEKGRIGGLTLCISRRDLRSPQQVTSFIRHLRLPNPSYF